MTYISRLIRLWPVMPLISHWAWGSGQGQGVQVVLVALQPITAERKMMPWGMPLGVYICMNGNLCSDQSVMK